MFKEILNSEFVKKTKSHKYILHNFSLEARLELNNKAKVNQKPQVIMNLILGGRFKNMEKSDKELGINFSVHQPQIVRILKLVEYIGYYNEFQRGSLDELYKNKVTSEISKQYVEMYFEWKALEVKKNKDKEIKDVRTEMKKIEDQYTVDKLIILRKFAMKLFDKEAEKIKKQDQIDKQIKKVKKEKKGGWGTLFMSKEKKQKIKGEVEDLRVKLQQNLEKENQEVQNEFDNELNELTASLSQEQIFEAEDFSIMPLDYIRFKFAVHLPAMRFQLINEFDQNIFMTAIEGCKLITKLGDGIAKVKFVLNSITLEDYWCQSKVFPNIIETKDIPDKNLEKTEDVLAKPKVSAFIVKFEQNKSFEISPFKLHITTEKTIFVIVNFSFIKEVQRTIQAALENETFDFTFYREAASEKAITYMQSGKELIDQVKKGEYTHQALDVSLYLSAPVFIIPQSIFDPNQPCLIADTGILNLESKLTKFENNKDYKLEKNPKNMYDVYEAKLHNLQIIIMEKGMDGIAKYSEQQGSRLIKNFDAKLYIFNCFEPMHPKFPTAELSVVIENVHVIGSIGHLQTILQVVNVIQSTMNAKEFQFFDAAIEEHKVKLEKSESQLVREKVKEKIEIYRKKQPQDTDESDIQDEEELKEQLQEDADQFFQILKENLSKTEIKKIVKKQQEVQEQKQQIIGESKEEQVPQEKLMTNFKVYASVNKIQFTFQDEQYSSIRNETLLTDFMYVALSGLDLEVEIDRKEDISIKLNVLNFIIKDVSETSKIANIFRLILSSPLAEISQKDEEFPIPLKSEISKRSSIQRKSINEKWIHENSRPAIRLITKSLLMGTDQEDFDEGFQDSISDEEDKIFNELDLKVAIKKDQMTNVLFNLTDMRLLFSVPTLEKLMKNVIKLLDMVEFLEDQSLEDRLQMIEKYELVIENLNREFSNPDENLIKKVFINHSKSRGIDLLNNKDIYLEGVNKMSMVWERQTLAEKVEVKASQKAKQLIRRKLKTVKEESNSSLELKACLNNFSVWIPLNPESENSQILSLSFMSLLTVDQKNKNQQEIDSKLGQVIKKEKLSSQQSISMSINHFTIEMLRSNEYLRTRRMSYKVDEDEPYTPTQLLTPCRISVSIDGNVKAEDQYLKNEIKIVIEPLYLKVGFKDIDFINAIFVQVDHNILKQFKNRNQQKSEDDIELKRKIDQANVIDQNIQDAGADFFMEHIRSPSKMNLMRITKRQQEKNKKEQKQAQKKQKDPEKGYLQILNVNVGCEVFTLALNDDIEIVNVNLILANICGLKFRMRLNEKPDQSAALIFTNLGIQQKTHKDYSKSFQHLEIEAAIQDFYFNYYNQKSLTFEPLIEPWQLDFRLNQQSPDVEKDMKVKSDQFLNVNLTFGMALTVRRIMDRVRDSLKSALIIDKINSQVPLTVEEIYFQDQWNQKFGNRSSISKYQENQVGFIFQNFTNLPVKYTLSNDTLNDNLLSDDAQRRHDLLKESGQINQPLLTVEKIYNLPANDQSQTQFCTHDDFLSQQREIQVKRSIGKQQTETFDESLKIDFKIGNFQKLIGIPIEGLGVYSYVSEHHHIPDNISAASGGGKKSKSIKKVGVIVNIKQDGPHKKVSLESQLLISNNNSQDIIIFVCPSHQNEYFVSAQERIIIASGTEFRAPLSWFVSEVPLALYMQTQSKQVKLFDNILGCFSYKLEESHLRKDNTKIVQLEQGYYTSVDIQGYKCLPDLPEDNPLQFLLSFNPPLKVSNYNFHSFDIREAAKINQIVAAMAPKESSFINQFNTTEMKDTIKWTFYDGQNDPYQFTTNNFSVLNRINSAESITYYQERHNQQMEPKKKKLKMEYMKAYYQELTTYEENFEYRSRKIDISSALHLMIYPKFLVINKTTVALQSENQIFLPRTNEYFNTDNEKVKFKVQGYNQSKSFEIKTIGMAGCFELELQQKNQNEVIKNNLPQSYIPEKLELGIQIKSAPTPFNKTTLIYIVPRFVVINQTDQAMIIKQLGGKEQVIVQGEQLQFYLESNKNKIIMVREAYRVEVIGFKQGRKLFEDLANDSDIHWSSPFSIEDIDDFQISYQAEEYQSRDPQWYESSQKNKYRRYTRIVVTSQDEATILVVLSNPLSPEYEIVNKTSTTIQYGQIEESLIQAVDVIKSYAQYAPHIIGDYMSLNPNEKQPYVWSNKIKPYRRMLLNVDGTTNHINIDNALRQKEIVTSSGKKYYVNVRIIGNAKRIEVVDQSLELEQFGQSEDIKDLIKKYQGQQFTIVVDLQGIGFSFVNDVPKELLHLSVYKINMALKQNIELRAESNSIIEIITDMKLQVKHLQLDNSINQIMPVILAPIKPLVKKENNQTKVIGIRPVKDLEETKEQSKDDLDYEHINIEDAETPFIQVNLCLVESKSKSMTTYVTSVRAFQFQIQEFIFQVETSIVDNNLKFVDELVHTFVDQKEFQVVLANFDNYEKHKIIKRDEVCPMLDASQGFISDNTVVQSNKMFMKYLHLGAIKANVTFKLEKQAFEVDITNPQKGFGTFYVLYSFLSGIASFSNSPLYFKELIILDTFTSVDNLAKQLGKNYTTQGVRQFYKLIGSSDLIGNPIGLVDKLGTGVIEFFNEPRKGLLKGPSEFVGGISKGVQSLATNVVSGSMDSVSRVTGSLYSVIKNVAGEKKTEIKKPDHFFDGLYLGVKGGVSELVGGFTGIFTKPVEKTKQEGVKGLFKGLGSGFLGAISAPITATLKAGSSITSGVATTASSLGNTGKVTIENLQTTRFRPPRYINSKGAIEIYNEDLALIRQTLQETNEGKYSNQDIKYFCNLPETKPNGEYVSKDLKNLNTLLVITDEMLLHLKENRVQGNKYGKTQILFKTRINCIQKCEVYKQPSSESESKYMLIITWYTQAQGQHKYAFSCQEYFKFEKVYNILSSVPQIEAEDKVGQRKERASRFCS